MREQRPAMLKRPAANRLATRLALGIAIAPLLLGASSAWAENFTLASVDFNSTPETTGIILHTGSIVPVRQVESSARKLVLDIDQVNTQDNIRTNFAGAANISHVIMQPLNDHAVRMIIRGENLGKPQVAFQTANGAFNATHSANIDTADMEALAGETSAALQAIQNQGTQAAVLGETNAASRSIQPAVDNTTMISDEPIAMTAVAPEESGRNSIQPAKTSARPAAEAEQGENTPLNLSEPTANDSNPFAFFEQWATDGQQWLPYGLLALLLAGIGGFVRLAIARIRRAPAGFEDHIDESGRFNAHDNNAKSFRELADAYRNKHDGDRNARRPSHEDLIGLRGLSQWPDDENFEASSPYQPASQTEGVSPAEVKTQAKRLESLITAMQNASQPKQALKTPPKKQALKQYIQQQTPQKPVAKAPEALQRQRAAEQKAAIQQDAAARRGTQAGPAAMPGQPPVNRAPAAQKRVQEWQPENVSSATHPLTGKTNHANRPTVTHPTAPARGIPRQPRPQAAPNVSRAPQDARSAASQGPLPGNPEVLNFLRNVAELMEKDGKTDMAKSIHKNLDPRTLGLS